jgi:hypothetical protein
MRTASFSVVTRHCAPRARRLGKDFLEVLGRKPIVVEEALARHDHGAQVAQEFLEALRRGDAAERRHPPALQIFQRLAGAGRAVGHAEPLQVLRPVRALDDVDARIVLLDERLELVVARPLDLVRKT